MSAHKVDVVQRGEGAWVCRCSCEWVTGSFPTREEAREGRRWHLRDEGVAA